MSTDEIVEPTASTPDEADGRASTPDAAQAQAPRSVGQNVRAMLMSQLVTWTIATIVTTVQPRLLGPVGLGQLRLAYALWTVVELLAAAGTGTLSTVEVAKRPASAADVFRRIVRVRLVCFALLVPFVAAFLWTVDYDDTTVRVLALLGVCSVFNLVSTAATAVLTGRREMGRVARVTIAQKIYTSVAVISLLLLGGTVVHLAVLSIALAACGAVISSRALRGALSATPAEPGPNVDRLLRAGVAFLVGDLVLTLYQQIDTVIMSMLLGPKEVGWYAIADQLFGTLLFLPVILTTALFPAIVDLHHRDPAEVDRMLGAAMRGFLLFGVPIGCATLVSAESFVRLVYGPEFSGAAQVLQIYGIVTILMFVTILLGRFAQATGRTRIWSALMVVGIAVTIPLDVVLVPWTDRRFGNGAMGGALSYIVVEWLLVLMGAMTIGRGAFTRATLVRTVHCAVAGVVMVIAAWPLRHAMFLLPGIVSLVAYGLVLLVTGALDPEERRQLVRALSAARSRARRGRGPIVAEGAP